MTSVLRPGLAHSGQLHVVESLTVPAVHEAFGAFADMPPVLATAYLVALVEATCIEAMSPALAPGIHSVGTHINLSHTAPTPVGLTVTADVELVEVDGRRLVFEVSCRDDREPVGQGTHERYLIDLTRFAGRLATKSA